MSHDECVNRRAILKSAIDIANENLKNPSSPDIRDMNIIAKNWATYELKELDKKCKVKK